MSSGISAAADAASARCPFAPPVPSSKVPAARLGERGAFGRDEDRLEPLLANAGLREDRAIRFPDVALVLAPNLARQDALLVALGPGNAPGGRHQAVAQLEVEVRELPAVGADRLEHSDALFDGFGSQTRGCHLRTLAQNRSDYDSERASFSTVPHVRVVCSLPNVFSSSTMKTAPFGLCT